MDGYAGLGLARATALTPTSPALDPLDEFQPQSRQIVAGGAVGYQGRLWNARLDYQREVDQDTRNFVSERPRSRSRSGPPGSGAWPPGRTTISPTPGSATPTRRCGTQRHRSP